MDEQGKQSEGASRQAIGVLMGGIAGLAIALRQIFANYGDYAGFGQLPWVSGLAMTIGGCFVGLIVATLLGTEAPAESKGQPAPPAAPPAEGATPTPPPAGAPDTRVMPGDAVEDVRRPDDPGRAKG